MKRPQPWETDGTSVVPWTRCLRFVGILICFLFPMALRAQPYALSWASVYGAGTLTKNATYGLGGTAGQPAAAVGLTNDADLTLRSGFWAVLSAAATAPMITRQPTNQTVLKGWPFELTVEATGTTPLHYQWRHRGVDLPGANSPTYSVEEASLMDEGDYIVNITNIVGSVDSLIATVTVHLSTPMITDQPVITMVNLGDTATLSVTSTGSLPLQYQWRHNGINITGATNATLMIGTTQTADGGNYEVVVANETGAVVSDPAALTFNVTPLNGGDHFADRVTLNGVSGLVEGSTLGYTRETGEPDHFGKTGNASAWYTWTAPSSGIVMFDTQGSTFDTLLAAYKGSALPTLAGSDVASDDDEGGFRTSVLRFNASTGMTYQIAIDGLGIDQGDYLLHWILEPTMETAPVIQTQPLSQTVPPSANVTFNVAATGLGLTYQWLLNGTPIMGETEPDFSLSNVQTTNLGFYRVEISTAAGRKTVSLPAALEIGPEASVRSIDKVADLPIAPVLSPFVRSETSGLGAFSITAPQGFFSVGAGTILPPHQFPAGQGSGDSGEPSHCGVGIGESQWFQVQATENGICEIDTMASNYDTVLAVYQHTGVSFNNLYSIPIACNDNASQGQTFSRVRFLAFQDITYRVVVDRVRNSSEPSQKIGTINVRFDGLGRAVVNGPVSHLKWFDTQATLIFNSTVPPGSLTYQWLKDGMNLPNATNNILDLVSLQYEDAGFYEIIGADRNSVRVTNSIALITVVELRQTPGMSELWGVTTRPLQLETTPDLNSTVPWTTAPLITPNTTAMPRLLYATPAQTYFFRAQPIP